MSDAARITAAPALPLRFAHERALVAGGGSGMGRAIALVLAEAGLTVYVLGRTIETLEETARLAQSGRILPVVGDIRDAERVDQVFTEAERDGPIGLLLNAAAGTFHASALDITPNGFRAVVDASLTGPFLVLQRWARGLSLRRLPGAAVIITTAFAGREEPGVAHSVAAKAGLESLIRTVAVEWGPLGIRVNAIAPGAVGTENALATSWADERVRDHALGSIPLGRFGEVDEIAQSAAFLLSSGASYITGTSLVVDGGWRLVDPPFDPPGSTATGRARERR